MINLLGLIEMYNTYGANNIYHHVATCLLKHFRNLDTMTSIEIADLCNVSPSTLNRFFRKMAYPMTVSKLPDIVSQTKDNYVFEGGYAPLVGRMPEESSIDYYVSSLQKGIVHLHKTVDQEKIKRFVQDICTCKKVIFLGCPIPQEVWRFQIDLTLRGIESSAFLDPNHQYEELEQIEVDTMVVYIQDRKSSGINPFKKGILGRRDRIHRFAILTSSEDHPLSSFADYLFSYNGNGTEQDTILMNIYINIIAMAFRENN